MSCQAIKNVAKTIPGLRRFVRRAQHVVEVVKDPRHHADLYYYKRWGRYGILKSEPIPVGVDASFELRMLTCKRDLVDALWTLRLIFDSLAGARMGAV